MPLKQSHLVTACISLCLGSAGVFSWISAQDRQDENDFSQDELTLYSKSHVPIQVEITSPEGLPLNADETTKLEAVVHRFPEMGNDPVIYHWNLPDGVEIQTGELSGVILGLSQDSATISISVKGLSPEIRKNILLDLNTDMNGQTVGATGVYSTHTTNPDLSVTPREPASSGFFRKASGKANSGKSGHRGLPPKGVHF